MKNSVHGAELPRKLVCLAVSAALCCTVPVAAWGAPSSAKEPLPAEVSPTISASDDLVVTYDDEKSIDKLISNNVSDSQVDESTELASGVFGSDIASVKVNDGADATQVARELAADPAVKSVEESKTYKLLKNTNDPYLSKQYHLTTTATKNAWNTSTSDKRVTVAVLDTGIDMEKGSTAYCRRTDLLNTVDYANAYDATERRAMADDYEDALGHGTSVAGCISAEAGNGIGGAGTSYNAKVLPVNVFSPFYYQTYSGYALSGGASTEAIVSGFNYVLNKASALNIKVINLSFGSSEYDSAVQAVINKAHAAGILTVAACGNDGSNKKMYPASYSNVLSVSACNSSRKIASWSTHNSAVDLCAPGVDIYAPYQEYKVDRFGYITSSVSPGTYAKVSGTSFSAPLVSGIAALLYAKNGSLSVNRVVEVLQGTATDLGAKYKDDYYGYGLVNAEKAVRAIAENAEVHSYNIIKRASTYSAFGYTLHQDPFHGLYYKTDYLKTRKAVNLKSVKAKKRAITVTWQKASGVTALYVYYRKQGSSKWSRVRIGNPNQTVKTITGLSHRTYFVKVVAYTKKSGKTIYSAYSKTKSAVPKK